MNTISALFTGPAAQSIGWALIHVLWQATLVAVALAIAIRALDNESARLRYAISVAALLLTLALPVATVLSIYDSRAGRASTVASSAPVGAALPSPAIISASNPISANAKAEVDRWLPLVVAVWLTGVMLLTTRLSFHWMRARSLIRRASSPVIARWQQMAGDLAERLGLRRAIRVAESAIVDVPTVVGWLSPVILMPASALSGLTSAQIEAILAHELAHIRRQDYLVNLLQTAIETLLFYHPGVWWISRQIRIERENCCDDLAVELCGDPIIYARALTLLEQMRVCVPETVIASNGGSLLSRIRRLVGREDRQAHWFLPAISGAAVAALGVAALLMLAPLALAEKERPDAPNDAGENHYVMTVESDEADLDDSYDSDFDLPAMPELPELPEMPEMPELPELPEAFIAPALANLWAAAPLPPIPQLAPMAPIPPIPPIEPIAPAIAFAMADVWDSTENVAYDESGDEGDEPLDPTRLSVDDLIRLRNWGVTPEYINEIRALGYNDASIRDLARLRAIGVTADYVREIRKAGLETSIADLIRLRGVGVTSAYVDEMRALGATKLSADDAVRLRGVGVTTSWAAEMKKTFRRDIPIEQLVRMRSVGVTPEIVQALRSTFGNLTEDDVIRAKAVGVDPGDLDEWKVRGLSGLTLDALVRLRAVGVDAEYADQMRSLGFPSLTADDLVRLKGVGVTPDYVRALRDAGLSDLSAEDLVRLMGSGVDAGFVREMKRSKH